MADPVPRVSLHSRSLTVAMRSSLRLSPSVPSFTNNDEYIFQKLEKSEMDSVSMLSDLDSKHCEKSGNL